MKKQHKQMRIHTFLVTELLQGVKTIIIILTMAGIVGYLLR